MLVWIIVWITIVIMALVCQRTDFAMPQQLITTRARHSSTSKLIYIIASVMLIMIAGCRYYVGTDFGAYYKNYKYFTGALSALLELKEPGIRLIYDVAIMIHDSAGMCVLCVAAVTLGLELTTIYRNTNNIGFALPLFTYLCWSACFNGVRQALAASVLFCGLSALRDKKIVKYAFIVFLAFLCHRSAIIMFLIYFVVNRKVNATNIIILIIASVVVLASYDMVYSVLNVVLDQEITGTETYWSTSVNTLRIVTEVAPAIFFLSLLWSKERTPEMDFYLNILVVHAVVAVTTSNSTCLARMVLYTMPLSVVAMAELLKYFPKKTRNLYSYMIGILYLFMEFYEVFRSSNLNDFQLRWFW